MIAYGAKELAASFRTVRKNTVQAAEEFPEEHYDFVAAPGGMSVRAMLSHMVWGPQLHLEFHRTRRITTLQGYDFGALMAQAQAFVKEPRSKAQIIELLKADGEEFAQWVEGLSSEFLNETYTDPMGANPKSRFENLLGAKEHEMHHRAQVMMMSRMVGVVPHLTRAGQERMAARAAAAAAAAAAKPTP